jgi:hypothetical protein
MLYWITMVPLFYYKTDLDRRDRHVPPRELLFELYTKRDSVETQSYYTAKYDKYGTAAPAYEEQHELEV